MISPRLVRMRWITEFREPSGSGLSTCDSSSARSCIAHWGLSWEVSWWDLSLKSQFFVNESFPSGNCCLQTVGNTQWTWSTHNTAHSVAYIEWSPLHFNFLAMEVTIERTRFYVRWPTSKHTIKSNDWSRLQLPLWFATPQFEKRQLPPPT